MCKFILLFVNKNPDVAKFEGKLMTINYYAYQSRCYNTYTEAESKAKELKLDYTFAEYNIEIKNMEDCDGC